MKLNKKNCRTIFHEFPCDRFLNGKPLTRPKVLFPKVTRADADKDLTYLIKYLFNFAFFKFGIEVTLVMLVVLIGTRMDVVALIYAAWLCILFASSRENKARLWPIFQWLIVALIILQYVVVVDLPPFFCFRKYFYLYKGVSIGSIDIFD